MSKANPPPRTRRRARRAIVKLLAAVDKTVAAVHEAKQARDELLRLAEQQEEAAR